MSEESIVPVAWVEQDNWPTDSLASDNNNTIPDNVSVPTVEQNTLVCAPINDGAINTSPELHAESATSYIPFGIYSVNKVCDSFTEQGESIPFSDASVENIYSANTDEVKNIDLALFAEPSVSHPLFGTWTLWYLEYERSKNWVDMQHEITDLYTVEDFWGFYMAFKPPSFIKIGSDMSIFRKGILPMWEDPANIEGGRWKMSFFGKNKFDLDAVWLDICLLLIGEALEDSEKINGAVVNVRGKVNNISVWTSKNIKNNELISLGKKLRDILRLQEYTLRFQLHKDLMKQRGPSTVDTFII